MLVSSVNFKVGKHVEPIDFPRILPVWHFSCTTWIVSSPAISSTCALGSSDTCLVGLTPSPQPRCGPSYQLPDAMKEKRHDSE